jgi:hypothetical protein
VGRWGSGKGTNVEGMVAVGSEYRARFNADTKKMYPDEEAHGFV